MGAGISSNNSPIKAFENEPRELYQIKIINGQKVKVAVLSSEKEERYNKFFKKKNSISSEERNTRIGKSTHGLLLIL
jgi:hypothetical protein